MLLSPSEELCVCYHSSQQIKHLCEALNHCDPGSSSFCCFRLKDNMAEVGAHNMIVCVHMCLCMQRDCLSVSLMLLQVSVSG